MNKFLLQNRLLFFSLVLFALAIGSEQWFYYECTPFKLHQTFQKDFLKAEDELNKTILLASNRYRIGGIDAAEEYLIKDNDRLFERKGIVIQFYKNDTLILWNKNKISEFNTLNVSYLSNKLFVSNGYYYTKLYTIGNVTIVGFLLIKYNYSIENQYIENSVHARFGLPDQVTISKELNEYVVENNLKNKVFSISFPKNIQEKSIYKYLSLILYLFSLFFLLFYLNKIVSEEKDVIRRFSLFFLVITILVFLKAALVVFKLPKLLFTFDLFMPVYYASSNILPSLGDLVVTSGFGLFVIFLLCHYFDWHMLVHSKKVWIRNSLFVVFLTIISSYFYILNNHFRDIIYNSSLNFEIHEMVNTNFMSLLGLLAIGLWYASFLILLNQIIKISSSYKRPGLYHLAIALTLVVVFFIEYWFKGDWHLLSALSMLLTVLSLSVIHRYKKGEMRYVYLYVLILLFSIYIVNTVNSISSTKTLKAQKLLAMNLASEKDVIAEYFLTEIDREIVNDSILINEITNSNFNFGKLYNYLKGQYFSGYFDKYDIQVTMCRPNDMLLVNPGNESRYCYGYFQQMLNHTGFKLSKTSFYFLDFGHGRVSYFGKYEFRTDKLPDGVTLFIQLDSRLIFDGLGYPELLVDKKYKFPAKELGFSYAKYYKGKLVSQTGDFQFSIFSNNYPSKKDEFYFEKMQGYNHLFYNIDDDNLLIVSRPFIRLIDSLVSFLYMFLFFFICYNIVFISRVIKSGIKNLPLNFRNKIELSFVGILLSSLIVVAIISIVFSFKYYKMKHKEIVTEKMQSIYAELFYQFENESSIPAHWSSTEYASIESMLRRMSNIFYSDINLYSAEGKLVASSRSEIFNKGLTGNLMNQDALYDMKRNLKTDFDQNEKLGGMTYLSVYSPLTNNSNELIGYINLPYFTKQKQFKQELTTMLISIINFYFFLMFVAISIAVFISNKITEPLLILQSKFSGIRLGQDKMKIHYKGDDEIGGLVNEYNRMVDEMDRNIELMAINERQSAWSEMAKQIAHEIKNPLTPMKLSIQHLQRSLGSDKSIWPENFERVSSTLIEQIDNLSSIASEFSNFAKLPKLKLETVDLVVEVKKAINLFLDSNVKFKMNYNITHGFEISADKEQLQRVLINIITNAIQAIPADRNGEINIALAKKSNFANILINDNGVGIPENIKLKLFQPNFTTKTGGMGLGLAIVKSIVESMNGQISFETKLNEGSTFVIAFPLIAI